MTTFIDRVNLLVACYGTQENLAKAIGFKQTSVSRWQTGIRADPALTTVWTMADKLNVSIDWLVGRREAQSEREIEFTKGPAERKQRARAMSMRAKRLLTIKGGP